MTSAPSSVHDVATHRASGQGSLFLADPSMLAHAPECAARRRGEHYGRFEYATEETVFLDPLPC